MYKFCNFYNHYKYYIFAVVFLLAASYYTLVVVPLAQAQEQSLSLKSLTVVPPTVNLTVNPGQQTEGTIKLINDSDQPLTFAADTQDFIVTNKLGIPTILPPNTYSPKYSAASWLAVAPSVFTINAHEKIILNYYIQVPSNARPGGHYAAVLFKPSNSGAGLSTTGATTQTDIGTLFSVRIAGPITEKANVIQMTAPGFSEYGPVQLTTDIQNNGDSDIIPKGTITFYDTFGQKVTSIYLDEHRIFPEAIREFTNSFGRKWTIGRFSAQLSATYGDNNSLPLSAQVSFVIFPWKVAVIIVLILIVLILGFFVWKKRKDRKKDVPTKKDEEQTTMTQSQNQVVSAEK